MMGAEFKLVWRRALQAGFHLIGIFSGGETGAVRDTENVRVDGDRRLSERLV